MNIRRCHTWLVWLHFSGSIWNKPSTQSLIHHTRTKIAMPLDKLEIAIKQRGKNVCAAQQEQFWCLVGENCGVQVRERLIIKSSRLIKVGASLATWCRRRPDIGAKLNGAVADYQPQYSDKCSASALQPAKEQLFTRNLLLARALTLSRRRHRHLSLSHVQFMCVRACAAGIIQIEYTQRINTGACTDLKECALMKNFASPAGWVFIDRRRMASARCREPRRRCIRDAKQSMLCIVFACWQTRLFKSCWGEVNKSIISRPAGDFDQFPLGHFSMLYFFRN